MRKMLVALATFLFSTLAFAAIDVNRATEADLDAVRGIGPVTSRAILAERKKRDFKDWDDFIARVLGVADGRAIRLSDSGLRVNGQPYRPPAPAAPRPAASKPRK